MRNAVGHGGLLVDLTPAAWRGLALAEMTMFPRNSAMTARAESASSIFPGFQILDAAGPIAAFEIAGRYVPGAYRPDACSRAEAGPVASSSGAAMPREALRRRAPRSTRWSSPAATAAGERAQRPAHARLRARGGDAPRGGSPASAPAPSSWPPPACSTAAAPPPTGAAPATSPARFPKVRLEPDRIFVRDGAIWTSAGITAGIDLALAMIAEDLGEADRRRDRAAARGLSPPAGRPVAVLGAAGAGAPGRAASAALLGWARERLPSR